MQFGMQLTESERTPLGVQSIDGLSPHQLNALAVIDGWNFDDVHERLSEHNQSPHPLRETELEFKRFMALVALGASPVAMVSKEVDEFWHESILFTRNYRDFCEAAFGRFIDHTPRTSRRPVPPEASGNFLRAYRHHFGPLPAVWNMRSAAAGFCTTPDSDNCASSCNSTCDNSE